MQTRNLHDPPGLQIWPRPLTFWPRKLIVSCLCPAEHLYQLALKLVHSLSKYCVHGFDNRQINKKNSQTNGPVENIMGRLHQRHLTLRRD